MSNDIVEYAEWTDEAVQADAAEAQAAGGGDIYKLQTGKNTLRFLPPLPGWGSPFLLVYTHFIDDAVTGKTIGIVCPLKQAKQRCPICERIAALSRSGNAADVSYAEKLKPSVYGYANAIVVGQETLGPVIVQLPFWSVYKRLLVMRGDPDLGGNFTDPVGGCDIIILKEGSGQASKYPSTTAARKSRPLSPDEMAMIPLQQELARLGALPDREKMRKALEALPQEVQLLPAGSSGAARASDTAARIGRTAGDDLDAYGDL